MFCAIFNLSTPIKFQKTLKNNDLSDVNNLSNKVINKWITSFTYWDNKIIICLNHQIKYPPSIIYFILNRKDCIIVLISSNNHFYMSLESIWKSLTPFCCSLYGNLSFSTFAKFSKRLLFLTPWYALVDVRVRG